MTHACRDPLQHREVEVDRVPARQHVGIERRERARRTRRARLSRRRSGWRAPASAGPAGSTISTSSTPGAYSEIASSARPVGIGLDVERQARAARPRPRPGAACGLSKIQRCARPANRVARDLAAALDAALDQIARGEPHVGLERVDAGACSRSRSGGTSDGAATSMRRDRRAGERAPVGVRGRLGAERARALGVGGADVEVRPPPVVADEERAAVLEAAVEVHDGRRAPPRPRQTR